ncbi:MAG: site-specific integrase [Muribaculaceae bacterium]|nr:site-specific integrase [Muribaculaceae bacterium]
MASIKIKFRPSTVADHEGTIYYQIIHERKVKQLVSGYKIFPSEWDESRSMVTTTQKSERKSVILSIRESINRDLDRLNKIDRKLDANGLSYTADDVIGEFKRYVSEYSLFAFMKNIIIKLKHNGKIRTSETYTVALNSFKKFRRGEDIMLDCLNTEVMEAYEAWHQQRGVSPNTISFYTRILRAVYNRAVEENIIKNRNPFRHVYTGVDKTVKRALPLFIIKKIKVLDLSSKPSLDYARDMFILSFMLRGMSFIDMAYLRKSDLVNGFITYRRRKTGQLLTIKWTKEMQTILDKYPENASDYLLPIIKKIGINERYTYRNVSYNINRSLKAIAKKVGITIPLTLYVARHSWASAAKAKGIPLSVISEGMGHDSETTTRIYLASLDTRVVDKANSLIIKSL